MASVCQPCVFSRHGPSEMLRDLHCQRGLQMLVQCLQTSLQQALNVGILQRSVLHQDKVINPWSPDAARNAGSGDQQEELTQAASSLHVDNNGDAKKVSSVTAEKSECLGKGSVGQLAAAFEGHKHSNDSAKLKKEKCKVFVQNINFNTSQHQLWDFFQTFGEVKFCRILIKRNHKSQGVGYVQFVSASSAERALAASSEELQLHKRTLFVQPYKEKIKTNAEAASRVETVSEDQCEQSENLVKPAAEEAESPPVTDGPISRLNDDTLRHIFSYLNTKQRIGIERVSRRWQQVSRSSWSDITHLNLTHLSRGFEGLTDKRFRSLMKRVTPSLKSIDVSASSRRLTDRSLDAIGHYAPQISHLNLSWMNITNSGFKLLSSQCPKLKWLKASHCDNIGEDGVWWILHKCKDIRYLNLEGVNRFSGKSLHVLTWDLETLVLNDCAKLRDVALEKISQRSTHLRVIHLNRCRQLTHDGLNKLVKGCQDIEELHLDGLPKLVVEGIAKDLGNLQVLSLSGTAIGDHFLEELGDNCKQLRYLDVEHSGQLSDLAVQELAKCKQLEYLNISRSKVTCHGLEPIIKNGRLHTVMTKSCENLTDEAFVLLLRHCNGLKRLDVSGCHQLSDVIIQEVEATRLATSDELILHVAGTSMSADVKAPPNVMLIGTDQLKRSHEPYVDYHSDSDDYSEMYGADNDNGWQEDVDYFNTHGHFPGYAVNPRMEDVDDMLENDDPLAMEDWDLS